MMSTVFDDFLSWLYAGELDWAHDQSQLPLDTALGLHQIAIEWDIPKLQNIILHKVVEALGDDRQQLLESIGKVYSNRKAGTNQLARFLMVRLVLSAINKVEDGTSDLCPEWLNEFLLDSKSEPIGKRVFDYIQELNRLATLNTGMVMFVDKFVGGPFESFLVPEDDSE